MSKKNYDLALRYFKKSLENQLITGNKTLLGKTYDKLADFYQKRENYQKALRYYLKKIEYCRTSRDKLCQANTYFNISRIYDKMGQYEKALNYLKRTVQIEKKINNFNMGEHLDYLNQLKQKLAEQQKTEEPEEAFP